RSLALAARISGREVDLSHKLRESGELSFILPGSAEAIEIYRHSTSHLMAHAVTELFPDTEVAIGPVIEDGFYYDFKRESPFTPEDLAKIEEKMKQIAASDYAVERLEFPKEQAIRMFREKGEPMKVELIEERGGETVSCYRQNGFIDLCLGPHVPSTGRLHSFKLLHTAGAYWRGDERNPMLQRIYGTAWFDDEQLAAYLHRLEEAKRRDHRKLGKELELFTTSDEVGPGLILWLPKGARVRRALEEFLYEELDKRGYELTYTPHVARLSYWGTSGHLDYFRENMFAPMELEDDRYQLKPMNCPIHIAVYRSALRSYRDLPLRLAEFGTVYRFERSGVLHGLMRVRGFTVDDAHLFCSLDQLESEIDGLLDFTYHLWHTLGFREIQAHLATRPEKAVGSQEIWNEATSRLRSSLARKGISYETDEGGGAFYGPKIDFKVRDAIGRWWQCSTTQVDFTLPERFKLEYIGADGRPHRPIMLHRAITGSIERFFGVLVEHFAGAFPLWLAPVQVAILPIAERHHSYAGQLASYFSSHRIRAFLDTRKEKIGAKIRDAQLQKVPYMVILGDKEIDNQNISVRHRTKGDLGARPLKEFLDELRHLISSHTVETN
ncbi:MAG TPA: threonine--tRNA ligase, partial [Acidobacteriota bacterium]|nr:threonine--tRNA ligase [Acidobacteriota bacterium]